MLIIVILPSLSKSGKMSYSQHLLILPRSRSKTKRIHYINQTDLTINIILNIHAHSYEWFNDMHHESYKAGLKLEQVLTLTR